MRRWLARRLRVAASRIDPIRVNATAYGVVSNMSPGADAFTLSLNALRGPQAYPDVR